MTASPFRGRSLTMKSSRLVLLTLCLSGCPSSCQQRRDTQLGEKLAVKVEKAQVEKQVTAKKGHTVTKRLRPDGTPWEIVDHQDDTTIELDRSLIEKAEGASLKWKAETVQPAGKPWWYWPTLALVTLAFLCACAWYLARKFFR